MKTLFESKTFWFGAAQILLGVAGLLTRMLDQAQAITLIGTGLGTIGFRLNTSTGISSVL